MLHGAKKLKGMKVLASDGEAGHVRDVYFDDDQWTIRHLRVDTGSWLSGRTVLVSPIAVTRFDWNRKLIDTNLTRRQIQEGPGIDEHKPVSRRHEQEHYAYYGYPYYWTGPYLWGYTMFPSMMETRQIEEPALEEAQEYRESEGDESHLRSCDAVIGYKLHASDDTVGHVEDFLFDDEDWSIRLIAVDTRNWWPGRHVLISPQRVERVSWEDSEVFVNIAREEIEHSQEYDPDNPPPAASRADLYRQSGHHVS